jgi:hypothetical protein
LTPRKMIGCLLGVTIWAFCTCNQGRLLEDSD